MWPVSPEGRQVSVLNYSAMKWAGFKRREDLRTPNLIGNDDCKKSGDNDPDWPISMPANEAAVPRKIKRFSQVAWWVRVKLQLETRSSSSFPPPPPPPPLPSPPGFLWLGVCYTPVTPVVGKQRQEDHNFEVVLGYIVRICPPLPNTNQFHFLFSFFLFPDLFLSIYWIFLCLSTGITILWWWGGARDWTEGLVLASQDFTTVLNALPDSNSLSQEITWIWLVGKS